MTIDIWSDIACPWCYVGKRRFEAAMGTFAHAGEVALRWHAFELDPAAPRTFDSTASYVERLAKKYRVPTAQAQSMIDRMTATGAAEGIEFRFDRIQAGNTFDAHRLVHFALEAGKQDAMKERLLRAYFVDGKAIADRDVLVACARDVGLDECAVGTMLDGNAHAAAVRADERLASEIGISGVPFFVLGGRLAVSGAQPAELLLRALDRAWLEVGSAAPEPVAGGAVCGPDGCA